MSFVDSRALGAFTAACLLAFPGLSAGQAAEPDATRAGKPVRVLAGVTLIDGNGGPAIPDAVVVISGRRIECAGSRQECPVADDAKVEELGGRWVMPGLVDAHVHFSQTGFYDGRPDAQDLRAHFPYEQVQARQKARPERYFESYLCAGVTAVFDVGGFPWSIDLAARSRHDPRAPEIAASGPLVTHRVPEILNLVSASLMVPLDDEAAGRQAVREMAALGADAVKVWFLPVEDEARQAEVDARVLAMGEEAGQLGIALIVHATSLREAKVALAAGAAVLVHSVQDGPVDDEFIELARAAQTVYVPTLIVSRGYLDTRRAYLGVEPFAIDDPLGCVDAETRALMENAADFRDPADSGGAASLDRFEQYVRSSEEISEANLRRVHAAGIAIAAGSDAGNPGTLHGVGLQAELEAMQAAGLEPAEIVVMATRNGARAMGRGEFGTLEAGRLANLIVVGADPTEDIANLRQVQKVMLRGRWVVEH